MRKTHALLRLFILLAMPLVLTAVQTQAADKDTVFESGYVQKIQIGDISILSIVDQPTTFTASLLPADVQKGLSRTEFRGVIKCYLVDTGSEKIIVDTGFGDYKDPAGKLVDSLRAHGYAPEQISHVLMTHLDVDHVAGLFFGGKPTFPNATLYISKPEYDAWTNGQVNRSENVVALAKERLATYQVRTFEFNSSPLPGIMAIDAHGHTPGHVVYVISSGDERFCIIGDLLHIADIQLASPRVCTSYDMAVEEAIASRLRILGMLADQKILSGAMHFPQIGVIQRDAEESFSVEER